MRYPLTFGFLTALLATGMILNMAASNAQQRACAARQHRQELHISQFRFVGPVVERSDYGGFVAPIYPARSFSEATLNAMVIPTARIATSVSAAPAQCCSAEAAYVMETRLDRAQLYARLGWERTSKSKGDRLYPVWTGGELEQPTIQVGYQPQSHSDLWDCSVGYVPSNELIEGMRQASLHTSVANDHREVDIPIAASSIAYRAKRFEAEWSIPTDARQADIYPGLADIVTVEARDQVRPLYNDLWQAIRSFDLAITSCDNPWQLIQNSMPRKAGMGCGNTAKAPIEVVTEVSLENEILESVCQLAHIHPSQIAFDPFFEDNDAKLASATGSGVNGRHLEVVGELLTQWARTQSSIQQWTVTCFDRAEQSLQRGALKVAAQWSNLETQFQDQQWLAQRDQTPASCWTEPVESWSYVSEENLPGLGYPISAWHWSELSSQIRHPSPTELARSEQPAALPMLQPIPAANRLGIRHLASRVYQWFDFQADAIVKDTLATRARFQSWQMQQNATLERMVMQQEEGLTR